MIQTAHAQDEIIFRKHLVNSGINGFFYGVAIDVIASSSDESAIGIPILAAGTSVLVPLLVNSSKAITPNSLVLSAHGKFIGWAHGFALATLLGGENAWIGPDNYKFTIALGAVSSISLGALGNSLGKNNSWTEGQVALYRHYGWSMPFTGVSIMAAISDEPRLLAASDLIFGAGGYILADKVYRNYQYTRGDVRAIQVLTIMTGGLGYGLIVDKAASRSDILLPALGVLSGTIVGQLMVKNVNLTPKQGLQTAYAATGGAIFGLGIALIAGFDNATPYYVIPYITGVGAYTIILESMRKKNQTKEIVEDHSKSKWAVAFMPQNIFLNKRISNSGYLVNGRYVSMQPLVAASFIF